MNGPPAELRTRLIQAAYEAAVAEGRYEAPQTRRAAFRARLYRDGRLTLLAPFFDYAFYAFENPDFESSGLDELEHYNFFGWRRLRNPAAWFDTAYYLASNPDVRASGDNPFWHYIFKGRAEGRAPRRPRAIERAILDNLLAPEARGGEAVAKDLPRLSADEIAARLAARLNGARGLLVGVAAAEPDGADSDARRFMRWEAGEYAAKGYAALGAAPLRAGSTLKTMPAPWSETMLTLDGETLGAAMDAEIAKAFGALGAATPPRRALAVHGLNGLSVDGLMAIEAALAPDERLFWLHDFASVCTSSKLMRNDVAFCGAPPSDSMACAVCIHGEARRAQMAAAERLFQRCRFTVVAPSERALALWRGASKLPYEAASVVAPFRLDERAEPHGVVDVGEIGAEGRPVRVAFIGPTTLAGGWPTFARILESCGELVAYAFHHFAGPDALKPSRNLFSIEVAAAPDALRDALVERRIDLVVMAAEWPDTFSFAALAALAAGCDIVALGRSGEIAALVERERRGRALDTEDEAVAFFVGGRAIAYARERDRFPRYLADIKSGAAAPASA